MSKYTSQGIVYSVAISVHAKADLDAIRNTDPDTANTIWALLQEAKGNQAVLDSFSIKDFGIKGYHTYNVDVWVAQQKKGRNIWRLKIWELEKLGNHYRIIYALDPRISRFYVLGIFERGFNYDESDPRTQRIIASYKSLGIPDYH